MGSRDRGVKGSIWRSSSVVSFYFEMGYSLEQMPLAWVVPRSDDSQVEVQ